MPDLRSQLILVVASAPELYAALARDAAGYSVVLHPAGFASAEQAVESVARLHPALLIAQVPEQPAESGPEPAARESGAGGWLSLVRSDPATRRIPAIGLGSGPAAEQRAAGLRMPLFSPAQLLEDLPGILAQYARAATPPELLAGPCAQAMPALVLQGLHEFNAGEYFECHETLETAWMAENGPVRDVYRAVLQVAVAYYQITRGNYAGARKMFLRTVQWFADLPERCQGIHMAQLRADAALAYAHLEALGPARISEYDRTLLKPVRFEAH